MRALVLMGVLLGAGYTASIWLGIEHMQTHRSAWNLLVLPIGAGSIFIAALFAWVLEDAFRGGR